MSRIEWSTMTNVDEVELVVLVYPLFFDIVDKEVNVLRDVIWLDRRQIETSDFGSGIFITYYSMRNTVSMTPEREG